MSDSCKTPKGTLLPLLTLKGKPYLQVAHRLVWLNEVSSAFSVETQFLKLDETVAICKASVHVREGENVRTATATKCETPHGFADFVEKAETGAIGRALAILGFGTQFTLPDLDEGDRIVDSPVHPAKKAKTISKDDF